MLSQAVFNTSEVCYQLGIQKVVLSPGSRNAPLTISFARNSKIKKYIIPDERTAAFVALGIAQQTKEPVALCCTSGSAILNYAPAIAEAYYRQVPLVILSADRPPELIDQRDGQTIRQFEALKNHVKSSYQLPIVDSEASARQYQLGLIQSIEESQTLPLGPVHINVPFREPFYPEKNQQMTYETVEIKSKSRSSSIPSQVDFSQYKKVLILIGQQDMDVKLNEKLSKISDKIPVIKSPLNNLTTGISFVDAFIDDQEALKPDLLITSGLSVLSKKLKNFIRNHKPDKHIHFDPAGIYVDTYHSSPFLIKESINHYIDQIDQIDVSNEFYTNWKALDLKAANAIYDGISTSNFSEASATHMVLEQIPANSILHLSNSMPVRYADLFGVSTQIVTHCNRGTSGIDGCTSTAIGAALSSEKLHTLITGDIAFFYDRNAFFHNYKMPNLRIVVMNNEGGGIFRLIGGPSNLPELEDYFETRHNRTARYICEENQMEYLVADDKATLLDTMKDFYKPSFNAKVLEIFTKPEVNQRVYKSLRNYIHEQINN